MNHSLHRRASGIALGCVVAMGMLTGCGSDLFGQANTPATTTDGGSTTTSSTDPIARLGEASRTTCGAFLAMSSADQRSLLERVVAENPGWELGARTTPEARETWAQGNCYRRGVGELAIGLVLKVDPAVTTAPVPASTKVSEMTCKQYLEIYTTEDAGIAYMERLLDENPGMIDPGAFALAVTAGVMCEKPGMEDEKLRELLVRQR